MSIFSLSFGWNCKQSREHGVPICEIRIGCLGSNDNAVLVEFLSNQGNTAYQVARPELGAWVSNYNAMSVEPSDLCSWHRSPERWEEPLAAKICGSACLYSLPHERSSVVKSTLLQAISPRNMLAELDHGDVSTDKTVMQNSLNQLWSCPYNFSTFVCGGKGARGRPQHSVAV